jgi:hypothetical protein
VLHAGLKIISGSVPNKSQPLQQSEVALFPAFAPENGPPIAIKKFRWRMTDEPRADLRENEIEGRYANYFNVGHNAFEVVLVFGQFYEGNAQSQLHTRIVTSPGYAKTLLELLRDSVQKYEEAYGPIRTATQHE